MQDSYLASEVCRIVNEVVEVRPSDVKTDLRELAEGLLGLSVCTQRGEVLEGQDVTCPPSIHSLVADLDDQVNAAVAVATDNREKLESTISRVRQLSRQISEDAFSLRSDIRLTIEDAKDASNICRSAHQCVRDYRNLMQKVVQATDKRFYELSSNTKKLRLEVELLTTSIGANRSANGANTQEIARTLGSLSAAIDQRWAIAKQLVANPEWQKMLRNVAGKVALQEEGRITVRMINKGTQSVDRVLDRVDEKAWFISSLSVAIYEPDIRDALKIHFKKYYGAHDDKTGPVDKTLYRNLSTAFVFASCEQLASTYQDAGAMTVPQPNAQRGSYLLYPLFSAAVGGLYEHLEPTGIDGQFNSDSFRTKLVAWVRSDEGQKKLKEQAEVLSTGRAQLQAKTNAVQTEASNQTSSLPMGASIDTGASDTRRPTAATTRATQLAKRSVVIELPQRQDVQKAVQKAIDTALSQ